MAKKQYPPESLPNAPEDPQGVDPALSDDSDEKTRVGGASVLPPMPDDDASGDADKTRVDASLADLYAEQLVRRQAAHAPDMTPETPGDAPDTSAGDPAVDFHEANTVASADLSWEDVVNPDPSAAVTVAMNVPREDLDRPASEPEPDPVGIRTLSGSSTLDESHPTVPMSLEAVRRVIAVDAKLGLTEESQDVDSAPPQGDADDAEALEAGSEPAPATKAEAAGEGVATTVDPERFDLPPAPAPLEGSNTHALEPEAVMDPEAPTPTIGHDAPGQLAPEPSAPPPEWSPAEADVFDQASTPGPPDPAPDEMTPHEAVPAVAAMESTVGAPPPSPSPSSSSSPSLSMTAEVDAGAVIVGEDAWADSGSGLSDEDWVSSDDVVAPAHQETADADESPPPRPVLPVGETPPVSEAVFEGGDPALAPPEPSAPAPPEPSEHPVGRPSIFEDEEPPPGGGVAGTESGVRLGLAPPAQVDEESTRTGMVEDYAAAPGSEAETQVRPQTGPAEVVEDAVLGASEVSAASGPASPEGPGEEDPWAEYEDVSNFEGSTRAGDPEEAGAPPPSSASLSPPAVSSSPVATEEVGSVPLEPSPVAPSPVAPSPESSLPERQVAFRAQLICVAGRDLGQTFSLREDEAIVGRGAASTIKLEEPSVSRDHARLVFEGGTYVLLDSGSGNGSLVNGDRVDRAVLRTGDTLTFGNAQFEFVRLDDPPAASPSVAYGSGGRNWSRWLYDPALRTRVVAVELVVIALCLAGLAWLGRSPAPSVQQELAFQYYLEGIQAFKQKRWDDAEQKFTLLARIEVNHPRATQYLEAVTVERTAHRALDEARALRQSGQLAEAYRRAQSVLESGYADEAAQFLRGMDAELEARVARARTSLAAGGPEEALELLRPVAAIHGGRADVTALMEKAQRVVNRPGAAEARARRLLQEASSLKDRDPAAARQRWNEVMATVPPGHPLHARARRALDSLR